MVGAINPNSSTPIAKQQQLARDSAYMLNPGEPFPPESPLSSPTLSTDPAPEPAADTEKRGLTHSVLAGIIAAVVAVVAVVILAIVFFLRRRRRAKEEHDTMTHINPKPITYSGHGYQSTAYELESPQEKTNDHGKYKYCL